MNQVGKNGGVIAPSHAFACHHSLNALFHRIELRSFCRTCHNISLEILPVLKIRERYSNWSKMLEVIERNNVFDRNSVTL
jgi:hypothetical protein